MSTAGDQVLCNLPNASATIKAARAIQVAQAQSAAPDAAPGGAMAPALAFHLLAIVALLASFLVEHT